MSSISPLVLEEFKQIHEHMREHERAMVNTTNLMFGGATTLLSAIALLYSRSQTATSGITGFLLPYLFLAPVLVVIPTLEFIRAHRKSLMKMGAYITVHIEEKYGGAQWGTQLKNYQKSIRGNSLDVVPAFAWVISLVCLCFFYYALSRNDRSNPLHYVVPPVLIFFPLSVLHYLHAVSSNMQTYEAAWRKAERQEEK